MNDFRKNDTFLYLSIVFYNFVPSIVFYCASWLLNFFLLSWFLGPGSMIFCLGSWFLVL